jgi:hypothetical protein
VPRNLLVTHVDHLDLFVQAGVEDRLYVPAAERVYRVDFFLLDGAGDEFAAVNQSHGGLLLIGTKSRGPTAGLVG